MLSHLYSSLFVPMLADWSLLKLNLTLTVAEGDKKNSLGVHDKKKSGMCESNVIVLSL